MDKKDLAPKVARWALFIQEFDHEAIRRAGSKVKHVDALNRNTTLLITRSQNKITTRIATVQERDEII